MLPGWTASAHGQLELRAQLEAVGCVWHRSSCGDSRCGWLSVPESVGKYLLQLRLKQIPVAFSKQCLYDLNPRFHYRLASAFHSCFMCKQGSALAASLPNTETLPRLAIRALPCTGGSGWASPACCLVPNTRWAVENQTLFPCWELGGLSFLGAHVPKRVGQPVMHEISKICFISDFRGTQHCQVQQQEKTRTIFGSLAPEFP